MSLGVDGFNVRHLGLLLEDYDLRDEPEAQPSVTNDKVSKMDSPLYIYIYIYI